MTNLIPWRRRTEVDVNDPYDALDRVEQMFDDLWRGWPSRFALDTRHMLRPAMDVAENDDNFTIRMDLPGLTADHVNVEVNDDVLTISGEFGDTVEKEGEQYHFRERSYGKFQRSLRLPRSLNTEKVDAAFDNGVLTVVLPKAEEKKAKQIRIKNA